MTLQFCIFSPFPLPHSPFPVHAPCCVHPPTSFMPPTNRPPKARLHSMAAAWAVSRSTQKPSQGPVSWKPKLWLQEANGSQPPPTSSLMKAQIHLQQSGNAPAALVVHVHGHRSTVRPTHGQPSSPNPAQTLMQMHLHRDILHSPGPSHRHLTLHLQLLHMHAHRPMHRKCLLLLHQCIWQTVTMCAMDTANLDMDMVRARTLSILAACGMPITHLLASTMHLIWKLLRSLPQGHRHYTTVNPS